MPGICKGQNCTYPINDHSQECVVEHWCSSHGITAETIIVALSEISRLGVTELCDKAEAWMDGDYDETI